MKLLVTSSHFNTLCIKAKKLLEPNGFEIITCGDMPYISFDDLSLLVTDMDAAITGCAL